MLAGTRHIASLIRFLAVAVLAAACGEGTGQSQEAPPQTPPGEEQVVDLRELGHDQGDPETAAMGVVEFSDFGCIHCAGFHAETYPALYEEFVHTGDVLWKYVPITIGGFPNGDLAGIAGECGGRLGEFALMRDHLYDHRDEWLGSGRGMDLFVEYAEELGFDGDEFRTCMEGDEARAQIEANDRTARQIGVRGTPTFVVQGQAVQGAPPLEPFSEALREMVEAIREAEQG